MDENKKPANPNAFAMCDENGFTQYGMTLRDYFAAKAMQGMQSNMGTNKWKPEKFASEAYLTADLMLKEREINP